MAASIEKLQNEYHALGPLAERFNMALKDELEELLQANEISLGVPIEHRVKKLESILEKIERKTLLLESVMELPDFIGLRLILLFSRDVAKTCELISRTFNVLHREDTQERLGESQFGYQSFHYLIQLPQNWLSVPSFASVGKFKAEIQIRTVAQHMWAAASHVLQYKQESNVPLPVRRSIYRVSAILETVDLEFERVLDARESYISGITSREDKEPLNVDLLAKILDSLLPPLNKSESEPYSELLPDLIHFGIDSAEKLQTIISTYLDETLKYDAAQVKSALEHPIPPYLEPRLANGVYFSHVGLTRQVLRVAFGEDKYDQYKYGLQQRVKTTLSRKHLSSSKPVKGNAKLKKGSGSKSAKKR